MCDRRSFAEGMGDLYSRDPTVVYGMENVESTRFSDA